MEDDAPRDPNCRMLRGGAHTPGAQLHKAASLHPSPPRGATRRPAAPGTGRRHEGRCSGTRNLPCGRHPPCALSPATLRPRPQAPPVRESEPRANAATAARQRARGRPPGTPRPAHRPPGPCLPGAAGGAAPPYPVA